jgi:hypothetical protein
MVTVVWGVVGPDGAGLGGERRGGDLAVAGHRGWRVAEPQQDLVAVADDVDGQPGDPADGLGVEQQDHRGDPGTQRGALLGEESAEQPGPVAFGQRRAARSLGGG